MRTENGGPSGSNCKECVDDMVCGRRISSADERTAAITKPSFAEQVRDETEFRHEGWTSTRIGAARLGTHGAAERAIHRAFSEFRGQAGASRITFRSLFSGQPFAAESGGRIFV